MAWAVKSHDKCGEAYLAHIRFDPSLSYWIGLSLFLLAWIQSPYSVHFKWFISIKLSIYRNTNGWTLRRLITSDLRKSLTSKEISFNSTMPNCLPIVISLGYTRVVNKNICDRLTDFCNMRVSCDCSARIKKQKS